MATQMTVIDGATLRELRAKIFRRQESTLSDEARVYSLADWQATLTHYHAEMRAAVEQAPEAAFEGVAVPEQGAERWPAGTIVRHKFEAQVDTFARVIRAAVGADNGSRAADMAAFSDERALTRAEALAVLDAADRDLELLFSQIPPYADLDVTRPNSAFGESSIGGVFLILAIHDEDHASQLRGQS